MRSGDEARLVAKAEESLEIARLLLASGYCSVAASRAYYCMFYLSEALLLSAGHAYSSHSAVIAGFGQHFSRPGLLPRHLHKYLMESFDARQTGDYGTEPIPADGARTLIGWAEEFLAAAKAYLASDSGNP